jgi:hypothetical protein
MEKIGLQAVLDTADFERGVRAYTSGVRNLKSITRGLTRSLSAVGSVVRTAFGVAVGYTAVRSVGRLAREMVELGKSSILAAGRVEELWLVLGNLAAQSGIAQEFMRDSVQGVIDYGIQTDIAQNTVAQFIRYQLDLTQAQDLARAAQDAAVFSMKDSSEALNLLIQGIIRHETRLIRSAGITVDAEGAFLKFAKSLDISTDQLTEQMRIQALMNEVLKEAERIQGTYNIAMESASKQLRSLPRRFFELRKELGMPFQDAFKSAVGLMTDFVLRMDEAVSEGGELYGLLQRLGAMFGAFGDEVRSFSSDALSGIFMFAEGMEDVLYNAAENALTWGIEISTSLAAGIIEGAARALTAAMNFISGLLNFWLGPGSPPRVAPDIDQWGLEAIQEWLHGMTLAQFDILRSLQRPLGDAFIGLSGDIFRSLAGLGAGMGVDPGIFDLLVEGAEFFGDEIAELLRRHLALADAIQAVQEAEEALAAAREAQEAAQQAVIDLTDEYNQMLRRGDVPQEVLDAKLRELQATEQERDALHEQVGEAEENLTLAEENADALEDQVRLQEELLRALQSLVIQEKDLAKGRMKSAKDLADFISDLPSYYGDPYDFVAPIDEAFQDLKTRVSASMREAFMPIRQLWDAIMRGLGMPTIADVQQAEMERGLMPGVGIPETAGFIPDLPEGRPFAGLTEALRELREAFDNIVGALDRVSAALEPFIEWIKTELADEGNPLDQATEAFEENEDSIWAWTTGMLISFGLVKVIPGILAWIGGAVAWLGTTFLLFITSPVTLLGLAIGGLILLLRNFGDEAWTALMQLHVILNEYVVGPMREFDQKVAKWAAGIWTSISQSFTDFIEDFKDGWISWEENWEMLGTIAGLWWAQFKETVRKWITSTLLGILDHIASWQEIRETWRNNWDMLKAIAAFQWGRIKDTINAWIYGGEGVQGILPWLEDTWEDWKQIGEDIVAGLVEGIQGAAESFLQSLRDLAEDAMDLWDQITGSDSPSKEFMRRGRWMMEGLATGIQDAARLPAVQVRAAAQGAMVAAAPVTTNINRTVNVNMGGINVHGGMDAALLEQRIYDIVEGAIA